MVSGDTKQLVQPTQLTQSRLKVQLKMAVNRLRLVQQKETALAKAQRREMAALLEAGKEASARIRVENIIREDINVELLEILELYCELLLARIGLLDTKECDPGLEEAVFTIIYSAPRTEIKELHNIRDIFVTKFGREFAREALEDPETKIPAKVMKKLSVEAPGDELVTLYLREIARAYNAPFSQLYTEEELAEMSRQEEGDAGDDDDDDEPSNGLKEKLPEPPLPATSGKAAVRRLSESLDPPKSPIAISPPAPRSDNPKPSLKLPFNTPTKEARPRPRPLDSVGGAPGVTGGKKDDEFDALQKRLDALRTK